MSEDGIKRICGVAWMRHRTTGTGGMHHEPVELPPINIIYTDNVGWQVHVCKHCGCLYHAGKPTEGNHG